MLKPRPQRRLSDLLPAALGPAAARQGFAGAEILSRWEAIVGPELAAVSIPQKLAAPPRAQEDPDAPPLRSTLIVRVEGAFALQLQHRTSEIAERVNAHLGWPCVGVVKIRQGALAALRRKSGQRRAPPPPATAEENARISKATGAIEDEGLAEALGRLGRAALASARAPRR